MLLGECCHSRPSHGCFSRRKTNWCNILHGHLCRKVREQSCHFNTMLIEGSTDYGGSLPDLTRLDDPLQSREAPRPQGISQPCDLPPASQSPAPTTRTSLSSTSLLNPFFGYPASSQQGLTSLQHGRRRKRDLARTLAFLFWIRWRNHLIIGLLLAVCVFAVKQASRRRLLRFSNGSLDWRALVASWHCHRLT